MKSSEEAILRRDGPGCIRRKAHVQERVPHKVAPPPPISGQQARCVARALLLATSISLLSPEVAIATPQTIARPALSVFGQSERSRFAESLGCSSNTTATGSRSIIAVGAPRDAFTVGGAHVGRVFIVDPLASPDAIVQRLESPSPVTGGEFGKAVTFIDDINGDDVQDLVVSQPSASAGSLFVFVSTPSDSGGAPSYTACGSYTGRSFLGDTLASVPQSLASETVVIAGSPRSPSPATDSFSISFSGGTCQVAQSAEFSAVGMTNSHFGAALALIPRNKGSITPSIELAVGVPQVGGPENMAGQLRIIGRLSPPIASPTPSAIPTNTPGTPTSPMAVAKGLGSPTSPFIFGAETDLAGSSIAGAIDTSVFGFGSPEFDSGRGKISLANTAGGLICTVTKAESENSFGLGSSLTLLGSTFEERVLPQARTFATFRSEPGTGGSVGLFGINPTTKECSSTLVQLNNCRSDSEQEQGRAIAGGSSCTITQGSETRSLIVVGSPGADKKGVLDIYVDKDFLASPAVCDTSSDSGSDFRPPSPPIDAFPGSTGLPSPNLTISRGTDVRIAMPRLKPTFKGKAYQEALRRLIKAGLSKTEATKALSRVQVLYAVTITDTTTASKSKGVTSYGTRGKQPPIKKIKTRRDRVTVRFASTSQVRTYAIAYRAEFVVPRPKHVVLGATMFSRTAKIAIGG